MLQESVANRLTIIKFKKQLTKKVQLSFSPVWLISRIVELENAILGFRIIKTCRFGRNMTIGVERLRVINYNHLVLNTNSLSADSKKRVEQRKGNTWNTVREFKVKKAILFNNFKYTFCFLKTTEKMSSLDFMHFNMFKNI